MQVGLFDEPAVKAPFDVGLASREFADTLYDIDKEFTREYLAFRVELYTRDLLAQFGIR
jgi:hypothetical protein